MISSDVVEGEFVVERSRAGAIGMGPMRSSLSEECGRDAPLALTSLHPAEEQ